MRNLLKKGGAAAMAACVATACTSKPPAGSGGPGELDHSSLRPTELKGRVLSGGDYLGRPSRIALVGERLLVLDGASDSVLHVVDTRNGRLVRSLGRRGEGPGEYRSAWSIAPAPGSPDQPWVYDLNLGRLTRVNLAPNAPATEEPEMIRIQGDALATQPVWVGDSLLVSPNFSPRGRFVFFGADGVFRRAAGPLPRGDGSTPPAVLQHAWMGTLVSNPRTGRLALATLHADQLEIYRPDGTLVRVARGPFRFDPQFTVEQVQGQPVMGSGDSMRFGYLSAVATADEIYLLFSGRTRGAFKGASSFGRYLHVYDWEGNLKRTYRLDSDILSIALSPDGTRLYGTRHEPAPAIVVFPVEE